MGPLALYGQVFAQPGIFRDILDHLPLQDIHALWFAFDGKPGSGHPDLRSHITAYLRYAYDRLLRKYVSDIERFRKLMKMSGSIISGSTALQFILTDNWTCNDLDICVPLGQGAHFIEHLTNHEGYELDLSLRQTAESRSDYYSREGSKIRSVLKLKKHGEDLRIDIVESETEVALDLVLVSRSSTAFKGRRIDRPLCVQVYHSTCVMDYIDYNSAHCLFPRFTFRKMAVAIVAADTICG